MMALVITLDDLDTVYIGNIKVSAMRYKNQIRLKIEAPKEIPIARKEYFEKQSEEFKKQFFLDKK